MGITHWVPRMVLPHAPQPRWIAESPAHAPHPHKVSAGEGHLVHPLAAELLHDNAKPAVARVNDTPAGARAAPVAESVAPAAELRATAAAPAAVQSNPSAPHTEQLPAQSQPVDLTPPRFELQFLRVSQLGVWITDQAQDVERMQGFAWRVLQAMSDHTGFMQPPFSFRWPFIESAHDDQSHPVAVQALSAQWRFFTDQGARYAVCFGNVSQQWLNNIGVTPLFVGASITEVMQSAGEKRRLWHALRELEGI